MFPQISSKKKGEQIFKDGVIAKHQEYWQSIKTYLIKIKDNFSKKFKAQELSNLYKVCKIRQISEFYLLYFIYFIQNLREQEQKVSIQKQIDLILAKKSYFFKIAEKIEERERSIEQMKLILSFLTGLEKMNNGESQFQNEALIKQVLKNCQTLQEIKLAEQKKFTELATAVKNNRNKTIQLVQLIEQWKGSLMILINNSQNPLRIMYITKKQYNVLIKIMYDTSFFSKSFLANYINFAQKNDPFFLEILKEKPTSKIQTIFLKNLRQIQKYDQMNKLMQKLLQQIHLTDFSLKKMLKDTRNRSSNLSFSKLEINNDITTIQKKQIKAKNNKKIQIIYAGKKNLQSQSSKLQIRNEQSIADNRLNDSSINGQNESKTSQNQKIKQLLNQRKKLQREISLQKKMQQKQSEMYHRKIQQLNLELQNLKDSQYNSYSSIGKQKQIFEEKENQLNKLRKYLKQNRLPSKSPYQKRQRSVQSSITSSNNQSQSQSKKDISSILAENARLNKELENEKKNQKSKTKELELHALKKYLKQDKLNKNGEIEKNASRSKSKEGKKRLQMEKLKSYLKASQNQGKIDRQQNKYTIVDQYSKNERTLNDSVFSKKDISSIIDENQKLSKQLQAQKRKQQKQISKFIHKLDQYDQQLKKMREQKMQQSAIIKQIEKQKREKLKEKQFELQAMKKYLKEDKSKSKQKKNFNQSRKQISQTMDARKTSHASNTLKNIQIIYANKVSKSIDKKKLSKQKPAKSILMDEKQLNKKQKSMRPSSKMSSSLNNSRISNKSDISEIMDEKQKLQKQLQRQKKKQQRQIQKYQKKLSRYDSQFQKLNEQKSKQSSMMKQLERQKRQKIKQKQMELQAIKRYMREESKYHSLKNPDSIYGDQNKLSLLKNKNSANTIDEISKNDVSKISKSSSLKKIQLIYSKKDKQLKVVGKHSFEDLSEINDQKKNSLTMQDGNNTIKYEQIKKKLKDKQLNVKKQIQSTYLLENSKLQKDGASKFEELNKQKFNTIEQYNQKLQQERRKFLVQKQQLLLMMKERQQVLIAQKQSQMKKKLQKLQRYENQKIQKIKKQLRQKEKRLQAELDYEKKLRKQKQDKLKDQITERSRLAMTIQIEKIKQQLEQQIRNQLAELQKIKQTEQIDEETRRNQMKQSQYQKILKQLENIEDQQLNKLQEQNQKMRRQIKQIKKLQNQNYQDNKSEQNMNSQLHHQKTEKSVDEEIPMYIEKYTNQLNQKANFQEAITDQLFLKFQSEKNPKAIQNDSIENLVNFYTKNKFQKNEENKNKTLPKLFYNPVIKKQDKKQIVKSIMKSKTERQSFEKQLFKNRPSVQNNDSAINQAYHKHLYQLKADENFITDYLNKYKTDQVTNKDEKLIETTDPKTKTNLEKIIDSQNKLKKIQTSNKKNFFKVNKQLYKKKQISQEKKSLPIQKKLPVLSEKQLKRRDQIQRRQEQAYQKYVQRSKGKSQLQERNKSGDRFKLTVKTNQYSKRRESEDQKKLSQEQFMKSSEKLQNQTQNKDSQKLQTEKVQNKQTDRQLSLSKKTSKKNENVSEISNSSSKFKNQFQLEPKSEDFQRQKTAIKNKKLTDSLKKSTTKLQDQTKKAIIQVRPQDQKSRVQIIKEQQNKDKISNNQEIKEQEKKQINKNNQSTKKIQTENKQKNSQGSKLDEQKKLKQQKKSGKNSRNLTQKQKKVKQEKLKQSIKILQNVAFNNQFMEPKQKQQHRQKKETKLQQNTPNKSTITNNLQQNKKQQQKFPKQDLPIQSSANIELITQKNETKTKDQNSKIQNPSPTKILIKQKQQESNNQLLKLRSSVRSKYKLTNYKVYIQQIPLEQIKKYLTQYGRLLSKDVITLNPFNMKNLKKIIDEQQSYHILIAKDNNQIEKGIGLFHKEQQKYIADHINIHNFNNLIEVLFNFSRFIFLNDLGSERIEYKFTFLEANFQHADIYQELEQMCVQFGQVYMKKDEILERKYIIKRNMFFDDDQNQKSQVNINKFHFNSKIYTSKQAFKTKENQIQQSEIDSTLYTISIQLLLAELLKSILTQQEFNYFKVKSKQNQKLKQLLMTAVIMEKKSMVVQEILTKTYDKLEDIKNQIPEILNYAQSITSSTTVNTANFVQTYPYPTNNLKQCQLSLDGGLKPYLAMKAMIPIINITSKSYNSKGYFLSLSNKNKILFIEAQQFMALVDKNKQIDLNFYFKHFIKNVKDFTKQTYEYVFIPKVHKKQMLKNRDIGKNIQRDLFTIDEVNFGDKRLKSTIKYQPTHKDLVIKAPFIFCILSSKIQKANQGTPLYARYVSEQDVC